MNVHSCIHDKLDVKTEDVNSKFNTMQKALLDELKNIKTKLVQEHKNGGINYKYLFFPFLSECLEDSDCTADASKPACDTMTNTCVGKLKHLM